MQERREAATDLDIRLADIDRTLRSIQTELLGDGQPEPGADEPEAAPEPEPGAAAPEPEPRAAAPEPEPGAAAPEPEPGAAAPEPEPRLPRRPEREQGPSPRPDVGAQERAAVRDWPRRGRAGPLASLLERQARQAQCSAGRHEEESDLLDTVTSLTGAHVRLLESYYTLLEQFQREQSASKPRPVEVTVAAGPFMTVDAVREFERALAEMPGVVDVAVRGYERGNRAIVDVELTERSP